MRTVHASLCAGIALLLLASGTAGGRGVTQHPLTNKLDAAFQSMKVATLAALPFYSDISETEDPDHIAAGMAESKFYRSLGANKGFTVLASSEVGAVLDKNKMSADLHAFYKKWLRDQGDVDTDFVKKVASTMQADAILVGAVDVWDQRKIDVTESGTARTTVGVLVGLIDGSTGKVLWVGRDENFKEALRYTAVGDEGEAGRKQLARDLERSNERTAGGVYAPPDFDGVVDIVVKALVGAFPEKKS